MEIYQAARELNTLNLRLFFHNRQN